MTLGRARKPDIWHIISMGQCDRDITPIRLATPTWDVINYPCHNLPDSKVHGANMGPIWGRQDPGGPHVGPMNFAIWVIVAKPHDDIIKWKHFPHNWSFERKIHQSPVDSPHKGQWCGTLMFSFICAWTTCWASNRTPVISDAIMIIMTSL